MDTTADYKALYLKKFFQWQDICHRQSIKIEELKKEITELKKQKQLALLALPPAQGCANPCVRNFQIHEEDYFQPKEQKQ